MNDPLSLRMTGFSPHKPHATQHAFLLLNCPEALYGGAAGGGKALNVDTPLPTPTGWTAMGDVRVGDALYDENGKPCRVLAVGLVEVAQEAYRLTFDDGSQIEANGEHLWLTFDARELSAMTKCTDRAQARRRALRAEQGSRAAGNKSAKFSAAIAERNRLHPPPRKPLPCGTVRDTQWMAQSVTTPSGRRNYAVPVAWPLQTSEKCLPLDPYLLGIWLGDGTSAAGSITTADPEVVEAFRQAGFEVSTPKHEGGIGYTVYGLHKILRLMGVLRNKHVPAEYLRASDEQRMALLQGLMDSDGWAEGACVAFGNTRRCLVEAVKELVNSFGWKARITEGRCMLYGKDCGPGWGIKWSADRHVFRLGRKCVKQSLFMRRTTRFRYLVSCERIASRPMRCIAVDSPSHLYLAGRDMVPTHNSDALLMAALQYVDVPHYSAILFRRTTTDLNLPGALMDRAKQWLLATEAHWSEMHKRFTFPSGATLQFGYLQDTNDKYRYQSAEFQMVGFDELTQFPEADYLYLHSRLRRPAEGPLSKVPLRMRGASNPGGVGHVWVRNRFIKKVRSESDDELGLDPSERRFIPARLPDNPSVDQEAYAYQLRHLDPQTRKQLLDGDWDAREPGACFTEFRYDLHTVEGTRATNSDFPVYKAIDFGHHHAPCLWLEVYSGRAFVFAELDSRLQDLHKMAEDIKEVDAEFGTQWSEAYIDPAGLGTTYQTGKTDAEVLIEHGINVANLDNTDRYSRESRTSHIKYLLRTNRLFISQDCTYLIEALERAVWDTVGGGSQGALKDAYKKDGMWDHPLDALGEALIRIFPPIGAAAVDTVQPIAPQAIYAYSSSQYG